MKKLVLFDIDGTLISTGGAGSKAMEIVFREKFGVPDAFSGISMAGKTDPLIVKEALLKHKVSIENSVILDFKERYIVQLEREITSVSYDQKIMPGMEDLLTKVNEISDVICGLLTGNWQTGADIKLRHFNLDHYFKTGVFADDSEIRNDMVPLAENKIYDLTGEKVEPSSVFVIGDTPRDIECAKKNNAVSIAVATGSYNYEELLAYDADFTFRNMTNNSRFLEELKK